MHANVNSCGVEITGIASCSRLESLDIALDLFTIHDGFRHDDHFHWLPTLLEEISSDRLTKISFTCKNSHLWRSPVGTTTFRSIDEVLTAPRFHKLEQVGIYLRKPKENKSQILEYFITYLPELVSRGLLMYDIVD